MRGTIIRHHVDGFLNMEHGFLELLSFPQHHRNIGMRFRQAVTGGLAIDAVSKFEELELVIVSGPALKKDYGPMTRNLGFVQNLHEIIFASDLVISLAGKSTIDEAKAYGTPGIFIPIKDHFEQEGNAREEGFSHNDVFRLESLITNKLEQSRKPVKSDGAKKVYEIIMSFLK